MKLKHLQRAQSFGNGVAECFEEEAMPALIASFDCQNSISKGFCSGRTRNSENVCFFVFFVCATRSFAYKDYECATIFCCMLLGNSSPQEYHVQHESRAPFFPLFHSTVEGRNCKQ